MPSPINLHAFLFVYKYKKLLSYSGKITSSASSNTSDFSYTLKFYIHSTICSSCCGNVENTAINIAFNGSQWMVCNLQFKKQT